MNLPSPRIKDGVDGRVALANAFYGVFLVNSLPEIEVAPRGISLSDFLRDFGCSYSGIYGELVYRNYGDIFQDSFPFFYLQDFVVEI